MKTNVVKVKLWNMDVGYLYWDDLEKIGKNNDIQDYSTLIDKVINAVSNFESYAKELNINKDLITNIKNDLKLDY